VAKSIGFLSGEVDHLHARACRTGRCGEILEANPHICPNAARCPRRKEPLEDDPQGPRCAWTIPPAILGMPPGGHRDFGAATDAAWCLEVANQGHRRHGSTT